MTQRVRWWRCSFASLLGVVGIYHTARGIDEFIDRRSGTTTLTQSGSGAEVAAARGFESRLKPRLNGTRHS